MEYITSYFYKGHGYSIIHDTADGDALSYRAIDKRFIDVNGNLTKTLNGVEMCASETLESCLRTVNLYIDFDELTTQGLSIHEALQVLKERGTI